MPDGPKPEGVTKNTRDASALFGGGVGYRINKHIRTDVTINYAAESKGRIESPTDTKDQKIHILTGLVNAYYDVDTFYGFTPYVGAGVGVARVETGNSDVTGVAGQVGIGTSYAVTDKISADLGYRYLMTDAEQTVSYNFDVKKKRIDAHQVTLGLRYNF